MEIAFGGIIGTKKPFVQKDVDIVRVNTIEGRIGKC